MPVRICLLSTALSVAGATSLPVESVDESRLWLPAKYRGLFLDLRDAARAAHALERCAEVLSGTLDRDRSAPEQPIFRILCRQADGKTYNEMVDGKSFKTLTTRVEEPRVPTPEELEALRIAEEKRQQEAKQARLKRLWRVCEEALKEKTRLLESVRWISEFPTEAQVLADDGLRYQVDFDAQNPYKVILQYRARCDFSPADVLDLQIRQRPK